MVIRDDDKDNDSGRSGRGRNRSGLPLFMSLSGRFGSSNGRGVVLDVDTTS
jgi:hypothetical protein